MTTNDEDHEYDEYDDDDDDDDEGRLKKWDASAASTANPDVITK